MRTDIQAYYKKLAANEAISDGEVEALLKEVSNLRQAASYLASCHAATLESLPKAASKASRTRLVSICETAVRLLKGDMSGVRRPENLEWTIERCVNAAENYRAK